MNTMPRPVSIASGTDSRKPRQTALLGAAVFLTPVLLACLFAAVYHKLSPNQAAKGSEPPGLTNRLADASVTNLTDLLALYREGREAGLPTDEVNLRIWAAQADRPAVLFSVAPPEAGKRWTWHLSQDGRFAVAVSIDCDALERRQVGLYDLALSEWVWKNTLPGPASHEAPPVFNRHLILRYVKKSTRFALELDPEGRIASLDKLGRSAFSLSHAIPPNPAFPGLPVAAKNGVFFVTGDDRQSLIGYALEHLPALRYAGKGDDNTIFSGNGLLKFTVGNGTVTVSDSLSRTVLQQVAAWRPATNIAVTGVLTTHDGSGLNVFLKTDFGGVPAVSREWSVSLATYTGTVLPSFNADAQLAKPSRPRQRQTVSRDNHWALSVDAANDLVISVRADKRAVAKVRLGALLGLSKPLDHIAFLEEGRHVVLRQGDNFWLLDFAAACGYADLLARLSASSDAVRLAAETASTNAPPDAFAAGAGEENDLFAAEAREPDYPSASLLALRAERCAAHQAWPFSASMLEACAAYAAADGRAPRVNPLLQARAEILSGLRPQSRATCRKALRELVADPSAYNRMIRYHLQGLLFAP